MTSIEDEQDTLGGGLESSTPSAESLASRRRVPGARAALPVAEAEQRFSQMAEAIEQDFWMMGLDPLRLLYSSPAAKRIWGFDPALNADQPERIAESVYPADLAIFAELFGVMIETPREAEYRILRAGEVRWLRSRVFPVRDANGRVDKVAGVTEDITARKQTERQLELYRTFERLIAELSAGFLSVSQETMDEACSRALAELATTIGADYAGISLIEQGGTRLRTAWQWRDHGLPERAVTEYDVGPAAEYLGMLARDGVMRVDSVADLPDAVAGTREHLLANGYVSLLLVALLSRGKLIGVLGFGSARTQQHWPPEVGRLTEIAATMFANVIARLRAEEAIRAHRDRLADVLRLGTAGQLASGIAHELNQPLGAIMSYARGCERRISGSNVDLSEIREALAKITDQAVRAADIIKSLRALVRFESHRDHHDVNAMVNDVIRMTRSACAKHGATLQVGLAAESLDVQVDVAQVQHVLLNLIRNALDAVERSGDSELRIGVHRSDSCTVEFSVVDNGPGIEPSRADLIFDEFYTTKQRGLGLGLAISRSIIEAHGGRLWLDRSVRTGTCFRFTLPLVAA